MGTTKSALGPTRLARVHLVKAPPCTLIECGNQGRVRQFAMDLASDSTTHFAIVDNGDVCLPQKNEKQLARMEKDNVEIISSDAWVSRDDRGKRCKSGTFTTYNNDMDAFRPMNTGNPAVGAKYPGGEIPEHVTLNEIKKHNFFITSATVFTTRVMEGGFDPTAPNGVENYGLWKKILSRHNGTFMHEPLIIYDRYDGIGCEGDR